MRRTVRTCEESGQFSATCEGVGRLHPAYEMIATGIFGSYAAIQQEQWGRAPKAHVVPSEHRDQHNHMLAYRDPTFAHVDVHGAVQPTSSEP